MLRDAPLRAALQHDVHFLMALRKYVIVRSPPAGVTNDAGHRHRVLAIGDTHRPFDPGAKKRRRIDAVFGGLPAWF